MAGDWRLEEDMQFVMQDGVVDCDIGGDRALLHTETNTYFTLNAPAAEMWLALSKPCTLDNLVGVVMEKFDVAEDRCRADAEMLLRQMVEAKIVTQTAGG